MATHLSNTRQGGRTRTRAHRSSKSTPYDIVTDKIVKALEAGVVPWRKPWYENSAIPCNAVSKRPYHGINLFLLGLSRYSDHRWLTYRQAEELNGHVRAGEQSSIAVFWKQWEPQNEEDGSEQKLRERIRILRFYHLFNVQQCDDLVLHATEATRIREHQRIDAADALIRSLRNPPGIQKCCRQACYYPLLDIVQMPSLESFETADAYYATLFHELGHATGHPSRLNRSGVTSRHRFGSNEYSREELVAELTSAFCCASIGLDNSFIGYAASYIDGWLKILKADAKAVISASAQAQRAAAYLQSSTANDAELESEKTPAPMESRT